MDRGVIRRVTLIAFTMYAGTTGNSKPARSFMEIHPLSHARRILDSFLILFGVSAMFVAGGAITQTIIELQ
jgi:hypothetical protein